MKYIKTISCLLAFALLASCALIDEPALNGNGNSNGNKTPVRVNIGNKARTILPSFDWNFTKYVISVEPIWDNEQEPPESVTVDGTNDWGLIYLPYGNWKIIVTAYIDVNGTEYAAVNGNVYLGLWNKNEREVVVHLNFPELGGTGKFVYMVSYPSGADAYIYFAPLGEGTTAIIEGPVANSGVPVEYSVPSGMYWFSLDVYLDGGEKIARNAIVHIYPHLTTYANYGEELVDSYSAYESPENLPNFSSSVGYDIVNLTFEDRYDVMKVTNPNDWAVALYELADYKNKHITINFSADVKRVGAAGGLTWRINNNDSNSSYPQVGDPIWDAEEGVWYHMIGSWTGIPTDDNPRIYLSAYQNNSEETTYYIDDFYILIDNIPIIPYEVPKGGAGYFYVDLNDWDTQTPESVNINSHVPLAVTAQNKITVPFTEDLQRVNFKLTDEQAELIFNADAAILTLDIQGTVTGTGDSFRYHIGNALAGSGWSTTNGVGGTGSAFATITGPKTPGFGGDKSLANSGYFILQHRVAAAATVEITSIKITYGYVSVDVGGTPQNVVVKGGRSDEYADNRTANVSLVTDGYQVQFNGGYGNSYGIFAVDFGTDKLSDFSNIEFGFKGISGDVGWKRLRVYAYNYNSEKTDYLDSGGNTNKIVEYNYESGANASDGLSTISVSEAISGASGITSSKVWFIITIHADVATFQVTNIKFVKQQTAFDTAVGMTTGIAVQGSATFAGGIIDLTDTSGSKLFTLNLPSATAVAGSKVIKVEYIAKLVSGEPKVIWKNPNWSDPANKGSNNIYPTLVVDTVATLEMPESAYADATAQIAFQVNGDSNAFKVKIISVKVE